MTSIYCKALANIATLSEAQFGKPWFEIIRKFYDFIIRIITFTGRPDAQGNVTGKKMDLVGTTSL